MSNYLYYFHYENQPHYKSVSFFRVCVWIKQRAPVAYWRKGNFDAIPTLTKLTLIFNFLVFVYIFEIYESINNLSNPNWLLILRGLSFISILVNGWLHCCRSVSVAWKTMWGGSHCSQFIVPKYVACFRPLTSSGMNCFDNIHWWHCIGHSSDFLGGSNGVEKHCIHWQLEIVLLLNCILSKYSLIWYFRFLFKCLFCVHSTTLDKCCPTTETDWQCIKLFHSVFV